MAGDDQRANSPSGSRPPSGSTNILNELLEYLKRQPSQPPLDTQTTWGKFWYFVSSGLFFLILGLSILFYGNLRMGEHHASFTFVLVVLGLALCLFGTGTQGMANIDMHPSTAAKINASLVGGAGAIAVIVGVGMAYLRTDIRQTFDVERKYLRLVIVGETGNSDLSAFASQFLSNGVSLPSSYNTITNRVEVLLAFNEDDLPRDSSRTLPIDIEGVFIRNRDLRSMIQSWNRVCLFILRVSTSSASIFIGQEGLIFQHTPSPLK